MELLILKNINDYVRIKEGAYLFVGLDKASVFPLENLKAVQGHLKELQRQGFGEVAIYKLILSEEPYCEKATDKNVRV